MEGLAARNGGRIGLAALLAILLLGLGLRADNAWKGRAPVFDAAAYATIAANLERGDGFTLGPSATQPASNYSPGLPLLAAGLYAGTGGVHERLARLVLAVIGSLAVLFAYLIGRRLSGMLAGLVGAAAVAVYPALLEYQGMLMSEPLAATLLSGAVLATLWADDPAGPAASARGSCRGERGALRAGSSSTPLLPRHPRMRWLVPGLLLGALALTRPEYLAISLPIAVVVFARGGWDGWREGLVQALLLLIGLAVIVAPWTVRNAVALDRFVPISTGGGQVLFAGSYMPSGGDPERVGAEVLERHPELRRRLPPDPRLEQILAALARQRYPATESNAALARMGRERLWEDISERPVDYAGFVAAKIGRIWAHGPRDVMREPLWEIFHWCLVALGLLGLGLLAWQRRWEALLLGVVLIAVTATGALLVASPRRVLVTIPLVAAAAGVATAWIVRARIERRSRRPRAG
jgi:4-amino-4-deoxy-L-arabinose transferase-like glycosyltransferase